MRLWAFGLAALLGGCNVLPPLDCLAGAARAGCQRDASGQYQYLYRSPVTPNGIYDPPPIYVPPPAPGPSFSQGGFGSTVRTRCTRTGDTVDCRSY